MPPNVLLQPCGLPAEAHFELGLIHVDGRLRESFIYDLLEPLRAKADVGALELLHKEKLHPGWFQRIARWRSAA
jgi:CRISPR/Cas system-associated endonuclease Cas1